MPARAAVRNRAKRARRAGNVDSTSVRPSHRHAPRGGAEDDGRDPHRPRRRHRRHRRSLKHEGTPIMSAKEIIYTDVARNRILSGVNALADVVQVTLGPK